MMVLGGYFVLGSVDCNLKELWWLGVAVVGGGGCSCGCAVVFVAMAVVVMSSYGYGCCLLC